MQWLVPHFTPKELAPDDLVLHEVRNRLAADQKLSEIFNPAQIHVQDLLSPPDLKRLPDLLVTASIGPSDMRPSDTEVYTVRLFVVVRYMAARRVTPQYGEPGIPTLMRHIKNLLLLPANRQLRMTSPSGVEFPLAREYQPGQVNHQATPMDPRDETGPVIFAAILPWAWKFALSTDTGRIRNLDINGM